MSQHIKLARELLPAPHDNAPGRDAIDYRVTAYTTALRRLLARLPLSAIATGENRGARPLAALSTRDPDDASLALLDAWAMVCDVLGFYQERIANEGYLATAVERRSIVELSRLTGYDPSPGVSASTFLAFTVEDTPGSPRVATIEEGTPVMSMPAPGKPPAPPQTFETRERLQARAEWNAIKAYQPVVLEYDTTEIGLEGVNTSLAPGDHLLIGAHVNQRWMLAAVHKVTPLLKEKQTHLSWKILVADLSSPTPPEKPVLFALREHSALFGHNARNWATVKAALFDDPASLVQLAGVEVGPGQTVQDVADDLQTQPEWPGFGVDMAAGFDLAANVSGLGPGNPVVLSDPEQGSHALHTVDNIQVTGRVGFGLQGRISRVTLEPSVGTAPFGRRSTTVHFRSDELPLARGLSAEPVNGDEIALAAAVDGLPAGPIAISGKLYPAHEDDDVVQEIAWLNTISRGQDSDDPPATLILANELAHEYDRSTVSINANVVAADHGQTVHQVLGSGDSARAGQRFKLERTPLTHVSAPTITGAQSSLAVRVDGVRWRQVTTLHDAGNEEQAYMVHIADSGTTTVIFGDGVYGARLPTGNENVVATYRIGLGFAGEVEAGSLSLMQARPVGVRSVENPEPATGAADPEPVEQARDNAPVALLTLDRLVSLKDYEDFAQAFAGIGKARATALFAGGTRLAHLSVADADGDELGAGHVLLQSLQEALESVKDPVQYVQVTSGEKRHIGIVAALMVDERYEFDEIADQARQALVDAWAFDNIEFGQSITASAIIALLQSLTGVLAVDLDSLYYLGDPQSLESILHTNLARADSDGTLYAAQFLALVSENISIYEWEREP